MFGYNEWVLGPPRIGQQRHVVTEPRRGHRGARRAQPVQHGVRRPRRLLVRQRAGAVDDRRPHRVPRPQRHARAPGRADARALVERLGAGLDPCGALHVQRRRSRRARRGSWSSCSARAARPREARALVGRCGDVVGASERRCAGRRRDWERTLGAVQVQTPDDSFDLMMNGWLLYQTLSCRLWARTGFYQPGGAFGFRDQLQDVMALAVHAARAAARAAAARGQPAVRRRRRAALVASARAGRGMRTRCSDDLLWLPYAVGALRRRRPATAVLDEVAPFLEAPPLEPEEHEIYDLPSTSGQSATLFEHCVRAIDRSLTAARTGCRSWGAATGTTA